MNYNELTSRYFQAAGAVGVLAGPRIFRGTGGSRTQGTWVQFDIEVEANEIRNARFLAFACPHIIAVAAWIAENSIGRPVVAALPEPVSMLSQRFEVPVEKRGRLLTVEDAWLAAATTALRA